MISKLKKEILNNLIDKYEARQDYGREDKNNRRTMIHINKDKFPNYFHISDSSYRLEFNADMTDLEKKSFVQIIWEKYNEGESIEKVILLENKIGELYQLLGRTSKLEKYKTALIWIQQYVRSSPPNLKRFYDDMINKLEGLNSLPAIIDLDSKSNTRDSLYGLNELINNKEEIPRRVWSIKLFNDSKRWEYLENRILWVLKNYFLSSTNEELEDEEILYEWGIIHNPQLIRLAGNIKLKLNDIIIDTSIFYPDIGLQATSILASDIQSLDVHAIITIENLTSFYDYIYAMSKKDLNHLVIYLGGYHNRNRRLILLKLNEYITSQSLNIPFYHWGDIDLGGFRIWNHLRKNTNIDIKPIFMDKETYLSNIDLGKKVDKAYIRKIKDLLDQEEYGIFHEVIGLIVEHQKVLEQEGVFLFKLLNE